MIFRFGFMRIIFKWQQKFAVHVNEKPIIKLFEKLNSIIKTWDILFFPEILLYFSIRLSDSYILFYILEVELFSPFEESDTHRG